MGISGSRQIRNTSTVFLSCLISLSLLAGSSPKFVSAKPPPSLALGIYTQGFPGDEHTFQTEVLDLEDWSQKRLSLVGVFMDLETRNPDYDVPTALERIWKNGKVGVVNLTSQRTAIAIATGELDQSIKKFAKAYARWLKRGKGRFAFLAPLPEMNGEWETYGHTPTEFKAAYGRIQLLFQQAGVPRTQVQWVFAPNGWSRAEHGFEQYYPGDDQVDIVGFSAYNWGYCNQATWKEWQSPSVVFGRYLDRMKKMAPTKPIFITQTASTSITHFGSQPAQKDEWLQDTYRYLATQDVRGILYFNFDKECDWALFRFSGAGSHGYKLGIMGTQYIQPQDWLAPH